MIRNYKANNKETGLVVLWIKLRNAGYYPEMRYPREKIQIDVKYVAKKCLSKELQEMGERYYQYTAIDEYSRYICFINAMHQQNF